MLDNGWLSKAPAPSTQALFAKLSIPLSLKYTRELELMAEMLWGFGGVKFVYGTTEMELPHCAGKLGFQELKNTWRTKSGNLKVQHKGFIPIITITMWNLGTWGASVFNMASLIQMLNAAKTDGIMIYPRYEYDNDLGYLCILNSDISPEDFSQNVGGFIVTGKQIGRAHV